ncbi:hypothetical protein NA57DRAFT_54191 [Rhizodiscina lignyota]|uniref:BTB domain-containing protein n=1 Tax=Rhizodiscina lignyota TaxID=1504668 RepID=A0A9P4IQA1_9PEZI|nr:hypothetical protein NA57DRAFT_54191 [Rhizodiscina lignyota]
MANNSQQAGSASIHQVPREWQRELYLETLKKMRRASEYTDFTITLGAEEFKVHRVVISSHSRYFDNACSGKFKEANDARIELKGDTLDAVKAMVQYFYTLDVSPLPEGCQTTDNDHPGAVHSLLSETDVLIRLADIHTIADKYEVASLAELATMRLDQLLKDNPFRKIWSLESIVDLLANIYTNTVDGAKIREVLREHILTRNLQKFVNNPKAKVAMMHHPEFLMDMLTGFAREVSGATLGCGADEHYGAVLVRQNCHGHSCDRMGHVLENEVIRAFFPGAASHPRDRDNSLLSNRIDHRTIPTDYDDWARHHFR